MTVHNLPNLSLLDNPIWNALTTNHAAIALGAGIGQDRARRYPSEIGPLSALREPTPAAYEDLATITPAGDVAVLFLEEKSALPAGWELLRDGTLIQMICPTAPEPPEADSPLLPLTPQDYPEMLELATLTEPGPFRERTADLGGFLGVRIDGRLAAMAGQRLSLEGFAEISAVCTHPDVRGRGCAQALVAHVARNIHASGRIPFLTSYDHNLGAIHVYKRLGFVARRRFYLVAARPPAA
ncbi:MAG TPA: GNAT family N-acetyltransferase [Granulicella sp.]